MSATILSQRGPVRTDCFVFTVEPERPARVVLSVPHDGLRASDVESLFVRRADGVTKRDLHVWPLVKDIFLTAPAAAVRGLMPRDVIDYNRAWPEPVAYYRGAEPQIAFDDPGVAGSYEAYHAHIARLLAAGAEAHGRSGVLLLDMHGFSRQPPYAPAEGFDVILGTGNRRTMRCGEPDRRLARHLETRGYRVFLPGAEGVSAQEDLYAAEHTTRHHAATLGVNAIQVEIHHRYRCREGGERGQRLARDIAEFVNAFRGA